MSEISTRWVGLASPTSNRARHGAHPCQGLYHRPTSAPPRVAFVATHYEIDFAEHYLARPLAERGFGFLGWNTRFVGAGAHFLLEHALIDVGVGVRWLREEAGADTVVLLGNSGGGSLMGAYQSQAAEPTIEPTRDLTLPDAALELVPGDLYVSLNAHPGRPDVLTAWLDPAVVDEADPVATDADLDLFARDVPLDDAFVARYRAAQKARNEAITDWAILELDRLRDAGFWDRTFSVARTWADPRFVDLSLDPSDREPGCYAGDPARANRGAAGLASSCTLRAWLSMWSLAESQCVGRPHLARVDVPALVVQSMRDKGVFPSDARRIHEALASSDKRLEFVKGEHYFEDVGPDAVADLIAAWVESRT